MSTQINYSEAMKHVVASNRDGDERRPEPPKRATYIDKIPQWRSPDHMGKADAERHISTPMHVSYMCESY